MRLSVVVLLFSIYLHGQSTTPFLTFESSKAYDLKRQQIEASQTSRLDKTNARILLAATYKNQDDLIESLEEKIKLSGENAPLRYRLGGANGIKALQVAKFFSIPYVKAMLENFHRAVAIDSTYTPAIEGAIESLCKVPTVLGGDLARAKEYAEMLFRQDRVKGYFAKGFIAFQEKKNALFFYQKAFEVLVEDDFCQRDLKLYFQSKSLNFPYKIAEVSATNELYPAVGICAINYFIANQTPFYNLPIEWSYFRKSQLLQQLGKKEEATQSINKALEINPNFAEAKQFIKAAF